MIARRIIDRGVPGFLPGEEFGNFLLPTEVSHDVSVAFLGQFVPDIFHGGVVEGDDSNSLARNGNDVGHKVQYGLGFSRAGWTVDHRYSIAKSFQESLALADV